jgi:hypothetical protein
LLLMTLTLSLEAVRVLTDQGGVCTTSLACATAVRLPEQGKGVLLVSTDPASNVGQVCDLTVGHTVTEIPNAPDLDPGDRPAAAHPDHPPHQSVLSTQEPPLDQAVRPVRLRP